MNTIGLLLMAGNGNAYIMLRYMAGAMEIAPKEKTIKV